MPTLAIATSIVKKLVEAGHIAYFAGGWVRDFLMKKPSDDIDIATSASVEEVQALFPKTIPVGVAFGIVIVVQENHQFEVATFRKDHGYLDGRRPTGIDPAAPEEDAKRRDFTINGMFYDPLKKCIYDYVGGQKDIENRVIRAIGNPHERFLEDRLRMMRAVRYSTRFDFPITQETKEAILAHATTLLPAVAMERIWQEFRKMSKFAHFDTALVTLHSLDLLPTIFPTLRGVPLNEIEKRAQHISQFPKEAPPISELLELFPHYSLEELYTLCDNLKLSNEERTFATLLHHATTMMSMPKEWQERLEKIEWAKFYASPHNEICLKIFALHLPPSEQTHFLTSHEERRTLLKAPIMRLQTNTPVIRAEHLLKEGIKPGKQMGLLLKEAERISVNENLDSPTPILQKLKSSPLWRTGHDH